MTSTAIALGGPLLLLGCGKMGGALLSGWLERGVAADSVFVVEPQKAALAPFEGVLLRHHESPERLPKDLLPAVVLLAVKPQQMADALPGLARFVRPETVFLSIAAGKTCEGLRQGLGEGARVVRAMPNTPAAVGRGMTVLVAGPGVTEAQRRLSAELMAAVGEVAWVEEEGLLDAVTALSGGGPAYVFLLIECLAAAGAKAGLPEELAMRLARETVAGAGELVHRSAEPAAKLRENVTSPGGTTLEALKILMAADGLQPLYDRAIAAAARRSRELAS